MKPHVPITLTAGTLANMTPAQLEALQQNVLAKGLWEDTEELNISGGDYLGVYLPNIFLGIEKDGYCHS